MKYIIVSGSSDIGTAIIDSLKKNKNYEIVYTYNSKKVMRFKNLTSLKLDLSSRGNIKKFVKKKELDNWDNLVVLSATQNPIGLFSETSSEDWVNSVDLNFTNQMFLIRELISKKSKKNTIKNIILWAGTGSNSAPKYYSAYTISKIAQTKMTELLDKEFKDIKVSIIGPGWVKTKIHKQTIKAGKMARENYDNTIERFRTNKFNSMKDVVNCFTKIVNLEKKIAGGRNFSVQFDKWGRKDLIKILDIDENIYKLRRDFNDFKFSDLQFNIIDILDLFLRNNSLNRPNSLIYKTFIRILHMRFILEQKGNKIDYIIRANDISRVIDLYTKKSKNRKIIKNCLSSKPIKLKKLLSILK